MAGGLGGTAAAQGPGARGMLAGRQGARTGTVTAEALPAGCPGSSESPARDARLEGSRGLAAVAMVTSAKQSGATEGTELRLIKAWPTRVPTFSTRSSRHPREEAAPSTQSEKTGS